MHIIIPMAGHSRRFAKAGLKKPKSLLPVGPTTMIEQVVEMFSPDDDYHFIINKEQASENPQIIEFLEGLAKKSSTVVIASHEEGPIRSVLQVPGISTNGAGIWPEPSTRRRFMLRLEILRSREPKRSYRKSHPWL